MQTFKITGYCPCYKCCGRTDGITASGVKAKAKHTLAAPSKYKFGTRIYLEGFGDYYVEDRGGAIKDNRLNMFFNTHQEALKWGVKHINGTVRKSK